MKTTLIHVASKMGGAILGTLTECGSNFICNKTVGNLQSVNVGFWKMPPTGRGDGGDRGFCASAKLARGRGRKRKTRRLSAF